MSRLKYGFHTGVAYSKCGLTNCLYSLTNIKFLLITVFFNIARQVSAFFTAAAICLDGLRSEHTVILKSFSLS